MPVRGLIVDERRSFQLEAAASASLAVEGISLGGSNKAMTGRRKTIMSNRASPDKAPVAAQ
jgi:hypothetical protein